MAVLSNSVVALVDGFYDVKMKIAALEARAKAMRAEILKTGKARLIGSRAVVVVQLEARKTLDADEVRNFLTPLQMAKCMKTETSYFVRIRQMGDSAAKRYARRDAPGDR